MDYEKAYKTVLKTATQWIKDGCTDKEKICLECVFPELRESENERIRQFLIERIISLYGVDSVTPDGIAVNDIVSYLEKQKEPVLTSIWKDTKDEIAPTKRGILGWYRKADGKLEGRPYIVWFCSEEEASKESEPSVNGTCLAYWAELPNEDFKKTFWCDEPKPAEWSEEDEKMLARIIERGQSQIQMFETGLLPEHIAWLKSLRPSWKPSEEHLSALLAIFNDPNNIGSQTCQLALSDLYEQLKKL